MGREMRTMIDFVAETNGHCFLCWKENDFQSSSSNHSLPFLSRYLKLDMRKVFTGSGSSVSPDLLDRVEKSKLRAKLCEECAVLTGNISKLLRSLEKIEMEVAHSLGLVQRRLKNKVNMNLKKNWSDAEDNWSAKLEITEALRNDAMQKCSRKLDSVFPVTKLQNLSLKQVAAEKRKIKPNLEKCSNDGSNRMSIQYSESNDEVKEEDIGSPLSDPRWNEDGGSDFLDEQTYHDSSTAEAGRLGLEYGKVEGIETSEASKQISFDIDRREEEVENTEDLNKSMGKSSLKADELNKLTIPPPFKVAGGDVKPQSTYYRSPKWQT